MWKLIEINCQGEKKPCGLITTVSEENWYEVELRTEQNASKCCMICWVKCFMSPWDIVCGMCPFWKKQTGNVMSWTVCLSLSKLTNKIPSQPVQPVSSSARLLTFAEGDTRRLSPVSCQNPPGVKPLVPCFAFLFMKRCCPALINYLVEI